MSELSDELKRQLAETTREYRDDIQKSFQQVIDRLGQTGINVAVIAGSLLVAYLLYRAISSSEAGPKKRKIAEGTYLQEESDVPSRVETVLDRLSQRVLEQTMVFLLTFARDRLMTYLHEMNQKDDDTKPAGE